MSMLRIVINIEVGETKKERPRIERSLKTVVVTA